MGSKYQSYEVGITAIEDQQFKIFAEWVDNYGLLETIVNCKTFELDTDLIESLIKRYCKTV